MNYSILHDFLYLFNRILHTSFHLRISEKMLVLELRIRGCMNKFVKLYISWFKIGLFTFGGGYAMIPMIQKEVVDKHHWVTAEDILNYYAISQCTPGAIAVYLSTFIGGKIDGFLGALISTLGVITPSIIIISIIATFLSNFSSLEVVKHALAGIQIAVCVLMFGAVKNLFKTSIVDITSLLICLVAFLLAYFTNIPTVLLVILAAVFGYVFYTYKNKFHSK